MEPLYFIGPDTEVQGGSVYPHDPGEYLELPISLDARGRGGPKNILMAIVHSRDSPRQNPMKTWDFRVKLTLGPLARGWAHKKNFKR